MTEALIPQLIASSPAGAAVSPNVVPMASLASEALTTDAHSGLSPLAAAASDDRHAAAQALTVTTRAFVATARHFRARGEWSADDTMRMRRTLKRVGRLRRSRSARVGNGDQPPSVAAIWRGVQCLDEEIDRMKARLGSAHPFSAHSSGANAGTLSLTCDISLCAEGDPTPPNTAAFPVAEGEEGSERLRHAGPSHAAALGVSSKQNQVCVEQSDGDIGAPASRDIVGASPDDAIADNVVSAGGAAADSQSNLFSLGAIDVDSLTPGELAVFAARHRFVTLVDAGKCVMAAVTAANLTGHRDPNTGVARPLSERGARHLLRQYRQRGLAALLDRRLRPDVDGRNPRRARTPEVEDLVRQVWTDGLKDDMPATAGVGAVTRVVVKKCVLGTPVPSESTVRRIITAEPFAVQCFRSGQQELWKKSGRSVVRTDLGATRGNERGQFDHSPLKLWARMDTDQHRDGALAIPVWITAALCAFSRSALAAIIEDTHPTAWTTSLLLRKAIRPKTNPRWLNRGVPFIYQPDRGSTLDADALQISLSKLHATFDPDPPYYPNRKGKIERFFQTLDENCLMILPGHKSRGMVSQEAAQKKVRKLLDLNELRTEVESWIVDDYHQWPHPTIRGSTIAEVWRDTAVIRMPDEETEDDALDVLLLKHDQQRVVQNTGIQFTFPGRHGLGGIFWASELDDWKKREVTLAYNPEDDASILVYDPVTRRRICEAWKDADPVEVIESRRIYEHGVRERLAGYAAQREARAHLGHSDADATHDSASDVDGDTRDRAEAGEISPVNAPGPHDGDDAARPAIHIVDAASGGDVEGGGAVSTSSPQRGRGTRGVGSAPEATVDPGAELESDVIDLMAHYRRVMRGEA